MIAPFIPLLAGGLLGLGGSALQASAQNRATDAAVEAAQFRPFDISVPGANVAFDTEAGTVSAEGQFQDMAGNLLEQQLMQALNPAYQAQAGMDLIPGIQRSALQGLLGDPNADLNQALSQGRMDFATLNNQLANLSGGFDRLGGASNMLGLQAAGLPGQIMATARGASVLDPAAQFAIGQGQGLLGGDIDSVVGDTLSRLRAQARPDEERAVNATVQDLFSRGVLGGTQTDRTLGELALRQEQADIQRQQLAEQAGLARFGAQQQAGQGLLGLGQSGLAQGRSLQQALAGLQGQSGFQGLNLQQGLLGQQAGFLGQQAGLAGAQFDAARQITNQQINRGQQRLANLQSLFGFGQQAQASQLQQGLAAISGQTQVNQDLRNLIALGGNLGGQQQVAAGQIADALLENNQSPIGAGFGGIGEGLLSAGLGALDFGS